MAARTVDTPTLLLLLDGWGDAQAGPGNAISLARTPNLDRFLTAYPRTRLSCSGRAVGLPSGFMGNSEVGHMNLGAGRVIYQDMTRIDIAIEDGSLAANPVLRQVMDTVKASTGRLHFMGLLSDGGVHSHLNHLLALLRLARDSGVPETFVHVFLDGRDTPPNSGLGFIEALEAGFRELGYGRIATVTGRYYAMDRDNRWDRVAMAHAALTAGNGTGVADAVSGVRQAYAAGENDEFVKPLNVLGPRVLPLGLLSDGDGLFCFNFRADRAREISRSLFDPEFAEFARQVRPELSVFATMTQYDASFPLPVAFPPQSVDKSLGQVVSEMGLRQLRLAETEKYAHVTYFFNCGREEPFPGEERILVPSPREVATYDLKPEMSVHKVRDAFLEAWPGGGYSLGVVNLANMDMVGHTGDIEAAVKAVEAVDECVASIVDCVLAGGGTVLLTADHGNAEEMLDQNGGRQTAHSKNKVPFVLIGDNPSCSPALREGRLGDVAPTILRLWNAPKPEEMTGESLLPEDHQA